MTAWDDELAVSAALRAAEHARSLLARANYKVDTIEPVVMVDGAVAHTFEVEFGGRAYKVTVELTG